MITDIIYFTRKDLSTEIGEITQDIIKPYFANGKWSTHELLIYLLSFTGPADIFISTFSIGEKTIIALFQAHEKKFIKSIKVLIDYTAKKHRPELLNFFENMGAEINIINNHSKIMLISNDKWKICVVGSGNMTPNPRYEAGIIFTEGKVFDQYFQHLTDAFNAGTKWN